MAQISAADVKAFRERTGLPLMDCKQALTEADGDQEKAIDILRKKGEKLGDKRADRTTEFGRFGLAVGLDRTAGAIVELKCESAPVASNDEFVQLSNDMAEALAAHGAATVDDLLKLDSPSKPGVTLGEQMAELFNRIREKFEVGRFQRFESSCGGYVHPGSTVVGVLMQVSGKNDAAVKDVAMHVAALRPAALNAEQLDPEVVAKEREILTSQATQEGKPANIVEKIVDGRLRQFFAERVLLEQPFVKDDKQTVGAYAKSQGIEIERFVCFVLGES